MPVNPEPKLQISPTANLEQAMAEVRQYLAAQNKLGASQPAGRSARALGTATTSSQFNGQSANLQRLSEIAARLGEVEPNSKLGALGVYLKRAVQKAIGWYSRPDHQFDYAVIEALQQIRQDMVAIQQQIPALHKEARPLPPPEPVGDVVDMSSSPQSEEKR
jgi:hypothetical protein